MRLDIFLTEKQYFDTRTKAKQSIERGEIFINDKMIDKPSFEIDINFNGKIIKKAKEEFVSLGGYKLSKALNDFDFNVNGLTTCDLGVSTGGFTDCLIQNGANFVYAIDVSDTLHYSLKNSDKIKLIVKNVRDLDKNDFSKDIDLITADLSFISETLVLPIIYNLLDNEKYAIVLIKPQFEFDERKKFKNGIIKDKKIIKNIIKKIYDFSIKLGLSPVDITSAGNSKDKNCEYLILLQKNGKKVFDFLKINF